jgi:uncharacterized protein
LGVAIEIPDLAEGDFAGLTITRQLALVERLAAGRRITLMGSSLGGYLAALYAARHPQEVERVILLAPAFRLAERWAEREGPARVAEWERTGSLPYFHYGEKRELDLRWGFLADARQYEPHPEVPQPTLIFHGEADTVVPLEDSVAFAARHAAAKLQVFASDHELGNVLEPMWKQSLAFLAPSGARV